MWNPYCNNHYAKFERVTVYYPKSCCNVKPTPPISTTTTTSSSTTTTSTSTSTTTTTTTTICVNCVDHDITIGTQTWAGCNLNVDRYANDDLIPQVTDPTAWAGLTTGAWCWYNNDSANGPVYGRLYNWYAVNDPRGLAPIGYHVATDAEWTTLINYLGGETEAGGNLKETGLCHWNSPNTGATNSSGFACLPGGIRSTDGTFSNVGNRGWWWSSTENIDPFAFLYYINSYDSNINNGNTYKTEGFSVRCIKD